MTCYNGALIQREKRVLRASSGQDSGGRGLYRLGYNQHFPQVSINLYSGNDWTTDRLDQWSQEARIQGKTSFFLLDPLLDMTKPLHQIALNWRSRRVQALYRAISTDDFPSTAFYLSKANYLSHCQTGLKENL